MSKLLKGAGVVALVAVVTVAGLGAMAYFRTAVASGNRSVAAHGGGGAFCGQAGLDAAAQALNMTPDELTTQRRAGASLSDLADNAGVDAQTVLDAVTAACKTAARDAIEQAVTDGALTRDHADWLLEGLDKGYWGGREGIGFGPHFFGGFGGPDGFGGRHGFGRLPRDGAAPTSTPAGSST